MAQTPNKPSLAVEVDDNLAEPFGELIGQVHVLAQEVNRCGAGDQAGLVAGGMF